MSNITNKIIKLAINKDEEAFNIIFEEYKHTVFYLTKKYLRNVQDTEECVQDFFIKLWTLIPTYNEKIGNFNCWLLTIAKNFVIDRYRKLAKEKERLSFNDEVVNLKEDKTENNSSNSYFDKLKEILTEEEYEILVYRIVHEFNFIKIAKILNTSRETVRRRYNEIISKSKKYLGGNDNE